MPDPSAGGDPIRIHTRRLTLEGVTPAAAADLSAGGTGGFDWIEGGPFEGTREAPDEEGKAEVSYDLAESARGHGYATEALRTLAEWALARDDVRSLFATIEPSNTPSQAVIARAGFVKVSEELDEEGLQAYELRG